MRQDLAGGEVLVVIVDELPRNLRADTFTAGNQIGIVDIEQRRRLAATLRCLDGKTGKPGAGFGADGQDVCGPRDVVKTAGDLSFQLFRDAIDAVRQPGNRIARYARRVLDAVKRDRPGVVQVNFTGERELYRLVVLLAEIKRVET